MEITKILDEIEKMVEKAPHVPLTGRVFLDGDLLLDYLDRLRACLPEDIREARWLTSEKERIIEEARQQAQRIISEAEKKAGEMAQESELVRKAQAQAGEITARARQMAEELRSGAINYAAEVLQRLADNLEKALLQVRNGLEELRASKPGSAAVTKEDAARSKER
ncbi:MAG: hypothetical protein PWP65_159 [Clostridia bacterium]|nr:hypothetical protein [Clostridia bacterium]